MIVVFGSLNADLIFRLPTLPVAGQTLLADGSSMEAGGKGANQAVAAARDGAPVAMVGAVGDDALAAVALAELRAAGVDLGGVRTLAGHPTGCAAICTDAEGRNQIAVASGANVQARADQVPPDRLGPETVVVLQGETPPEETATVIARARTAGCRVILNLAPAIRLAPAILAQLDILVVNEDEAATLAGWLGTGAEAADLRAALGIAVVRTLGADGAEAATPAGRIAVPAPAIAAIDTTAAGDCFVGVLASGLHRGLDLPAAMRRAVAAASLACLRPGSQRSLPLRAETDDALAD